MRWSRKNKAEAPAWKLLLLTALAGLIFGLIGFGEIVEDTLRAGRNSLHVHKASGDIVLVSIDDESVQKVGRWPWPRRYHAELADRLTAAGAKRIFFDITFEAGSEPADDRLFAGAIERSGRVVLALRTRTGALGGRAEVTGAPLPMFQKHAQLGAVSVVYNYQNAAWKLPFGYDVGGKTIPSFASRLANRSGRPGTFFTPDYSIDPHSVPSVPAWSVIEGDIRPGSLAGKDVVIGVTTDAIGDQYFLPGWRKMGGAYVQITGAETLKKGNPASFGWVPAFFLALVVAALASSLSSRLVQGGILAATAVALLVGPAFLEANLIYVDIMPGLFVVAVIGFVLTWRGWRQRGLVNTVTGLPNFHALRTHRAGRNQALVVARVLNYAEIAAALPPEQERQLVEQIVSRLRVGAPERALYQGDGGIFAWFEEPRLPFGNHLEALYALFRNPARVQGQPIDLPISFGVEIGSGRSLGNRLASALVAAEEAAHDGLKWKYYDPGSLEDASWKLSMLSQLDAAVDRGEVWVAYQPKLDLKSRQIVGAEALARWTHPEKGPIAASEFIAAAEQHDRIAKLTDFVLENAIKAAATFNRKQGGFGIAVNLSARLLTDRGFVLRLQAMLARHGVSPHLLTLELTETAALAGGGSAFDMLAALRELGVTISIDDYGTGLSTLDYLKKIPAGEIKIDQSFVKAMLDNRSDRVMVQSTIALAHSLGRKVVAEGVENASVLDALVEMNCDVAQGFIIGRPMSIDSLIKRVGTARGQRVA